MFNKVLDHLEEWLIAFLMGAATLVIAMAVLHRFLAGVPVVQDWVIRFDVSWAQELCIYMFIWMAKFGAAYGVRHGTHVGVDVLVRALPPVQARWLTLFGLFGGVVFTAVIGTMGAVLVWDDGMHFAWLSHLGRNVGDLSEGATTPDLELPVWIEYLAIPLASYLMCFRFLQVLVRYWRTGELPKHEVAHVDGLADVDNYEPTPQGTIVK